MAGFPVTGDQYRTIDRRMSDIKRQLCVADGSPLDPAQVADALQRIVEGNFNKIPQGLRRLIDGDTKSYVPAGWSIKAEDQLPNVVRGEIEFDPAKVQFHLDDAQKTGTIVGNKLKEKLAKLSAVYGAQVLDHLLANTNLIPDSWKTDENGQTRYLYFWGTIYRDSDGRLYVRSLYFGDGQWRWISRWLGGKFDTQYPTAVLAS